MPLDLDITYSKILEGIFASTFGDQQPEFLLCGPDTFTALYRWYLEAEQENARSDNGVSWTNPPSKFTIEGAHVIAVCDWPEGELRCVSSLRFCRDPRCNGTIDLKRKESQCHNSSMKS